MEVWILSNSPDGQLKSALIPQPLLPGQEKGRKSSSKSLSLSGRGI